jgi:hypothetical protein
VNWKIPGWAAGAGAVISLTAGLAGGNAFGTILLRVVVSAVLAGALGFGAQYVLRRFLPGFGAGAQEAPQAVDILIDEEIPVAAQEGRRPEASGGGRSGEELPASGQDSLGQSLEAGLGMEELAAQEAEPFAASAEGPADSEGFGLAPGPVPSFEPLAQALEAPEGEEELPAGESLEALPAPGEPDDGLGGQVAAPGRRALKAEELEAQLDNVTKGQDPVSLAKAVRTFLRKDQEG